MIDIFEEKNLTPEGIIDFNNINKSALGKISRAVVDKVSSGEDDALNVYIKAKALQEVANNIIKDVKLEATDEAGKYEKGDNKMMGCEFVVKNGSTKYSFDHDDEWLRIKEEINTLQAQLKEREKKMIDATKFAEAIDSETGEVVPAAEVLSSTGSILTITIPKE